MPLPPDFTRQFINLADPRLGAEVYYATDEFFGAKDRMLKPAAPVFVPDKYDQNGKWMDGWESRRKRTDSFDFSLISLGNAGIIRGVEINTQHFTGNHAPMASVEACNSPNKVPLETDDWEEVLPPSELNGDAVQYFGIASSKRYTHIKLNIFPDGGIARFRVFGSINKDWVDHDLSKNIDLVAALNGGRPIACSNVHFGILANMISPGQGQNMGDGWETARRRNGGNDWAILALCKTGTISEISIDTSFFIGNYPPECSIDGLLIENTEKESDLETSNRWRPILGKQVLTHDKIHTFKINKNNLTETSHIRLNIFPDGGISRLRAYGHIKNIK